MGVETLSTKNELILEGAFRPITSSTDESFACSRQWTILALPVDFGDDKHGIHLILFPLRKCKRDFILSQCLKLPPQCTIEDIGFYGDDGKSSLSTGKDTSTGKEGRQALSLILKYETEQSLWLIDYDNIKFDVVPLANMDQIINLSRMPFNFTSSLLVLPWKDGEDNEEDGSIIIARSKLIASF